MHYSSADISYWLAALHLEGIGPIRLRQWLQHLGDLKNLFTAPLLQLQGLGMTARQIHALKNLNWATVKKDKLWGEKENCHLVACDSEKYPALLREIPDAPLLLFVRGNIELLNHPQLAIVGSRNPTAGGALLAEQFAFHLAQAGLVITSGLALGVDAASHRGALKSGGSTIAICGNGLQMVYPRSHQRLADDIVTQGALVSEFPPDTQPKPCHFPMRNRVISGMSLGVLVVEAALRSGSLITARFAGEQGREVFALPGSIHNPMARGCHQLIRQGAKLIETAEDILEDLGALNKARMEASSIQKRPELDPELESMLQQIGYEITPLDAIIIKSKLTATEVSSMLLSLELMGYVQIVPGGYVRTT